MKRFILLSIALMMALSATAQSYDDSRSLKLGRKGYEHYDHEIRLTVGYMPISDHDLFSGYYWADVFVPEKNYNVLYPSSQYYRGKYKISGGYSLSYMYSPRKWFSFGLYVGYGCDWFTTNLNLTEEVVKTHYEHHIMFVPTVRFSYLNRRIVRLYSSLGIGYGICAERTKEPDGKVLERSNEAFCPVQFTPIGISVGRRLYGFAECTVGSLACFSAGIGYKF